MAEEEGPVGPEAIAAAQQLAEQMARIEEIQGNLKTDAEKELFIKQQTLAAQREELKLIAEAKVTGDEILANLQKEIEFIEAKGTAMTAAAKRLLETLPGLRLVHQTGPRDEDRVREAYADLPRGRVEVAPFLDDMPRRFAEADLLAMLSVNE